MNNYRKVSEKSGRVICIIGSPASGKTYLADKLASHYNAVTIHEQPENGFPQQIVHNLATQSNLFETILWFRNLQIEYHRNARTLASEGETVIMDTTFYQNQLYVDLYIQNVFHKETLFTMGQIDRLLLRQADCTIYISSTPQTVQSFLAKRKGDRSWEDDKWGSLIMTFPRFYGQSVKQLCQSLELGRAV